jgi:alcohol dehydrogenase class IV
MRADLGVPHTLQNVEGMSEAKAQELAPLALSDAALGGNPCPASEAELAQIMRDALVGKIP